MEGSRRRHTSPSPPSPLLLFPRTELITRGESLFRAAKRGRKARRKAALDDDDDDDAAVRKRHGVLQAFVSMQ